MPVMRLGDSAVVQPFRFSLLIVAALLQLALFGTWPDAWTTVGGLIITCCGVASLRTSDEKARKTGAAGAAAKSGGVGADDATCETKGKAASPSGSEHATAALNVSKVTSDTYVEPEGGA